MVKTQLAFQVRDQNATMVFAQKKHACVAKGTCAMILGIDALEGGQ